MSLTSNTISTSNIYSYDNVYTIGTSTTPLYTISGGPSYSVSVAQSPSCSVSVAQEGTISLKGQQTIKYSTEPETVKCEEKSKINKEIEDLLKRAKKNSCHYFTYVKEYVPFKVYEFTIKSCGNNKEEKIKTICDESDEFDFDLAFALAYAKYLYPKQLTPEGYVHKAKEMLYEKQTLKMIKYGKKLYRLLQEKKYEEEEQEKLKKERHKKYIEKKKKRDLRKKNDLKNLITQAIEDAK